MNTKVAEVLERARELMADGHWCKGRNENHGSYCIRGAIAKAATGDAYGKNRLFLDVRDWLLRFVPVADCLPGSNLEFFNDQAASWAQVDALLARAAKEARAA